MKTTILSVAALSALAGLTQAATMFTGLTATASNDVTNADGASVAAGPGQQYGGGGLAALTNDGFAYDVDNPTANFPANASGTVAGNIILFHSDHTNGEAVTIDFTLDSTAVGIGDTLFVDLYGRTSDPGRDDSITVEFFDGATSLGTTSTVGIDGDFHARAGLVLASTGNVTGFTISGGDTEGAAAANYFTLVEVRGGVEAIPEPSSTALLGLGGLDLILRRRK